MEKKPVISLIAAIGRNRELGKDNRLPWNIPEDSKYFRDTIKRHPAIMGRKTYESVLSYTGRPIGCKHNIVITRNRNYTANHHNVTVTYSLEEALKKAKQIEEEEIFVTGGANVYNQAIEYADRLYLTLIHEAFEEADTFFPEYGKFDKVISKRKSSSDTYNYTFLVLEK